LHEIAQIEIFNEKGQKIREFNVILSGDEGDRNKGTVIWDGVNESNEPVSSGVYFYILNVHGKTEETKKMLLLK
jgi:hypothetical protein